MKKNLIAAIDVGSHAIRMKIGELDRQGNFKTLESFRKIAVIGHDTFREGMVAFDTVEKVCSILENFKVVMDTYKINEYRAVATSAIREAKNRDYIVDQILLKTGFEVEVIDNSQEQFLTLMALKSQLTDFNAYCQEGAIILVIGAGSIQVTSYAKGELVSSQNVKLGALRVREGLMSLEKNSLHYMDVLKEYIDINLQGLQVFDSEENYTNLILVGGELSALSEYLEKDIDVIKGTIKKKKLVNLMDELADYSPDEISLKYNIKLERAQIIKPSLMLMHYFMEKTTGKQLVIPNVSLTDGLVQSIYEERTQLFMDDDSKKDILTNARRMALRFEYDQVHTEYVEIMALQLFDKLKKVHGLTNERVLLRVAAILHDIGKFIALDNHGHHSYELIQSLELFGLSSLEVSMIANVAKYHSSNAPKDEDVGYSRLPRKQKVISAKLIAILRLADALDRGHQQKITVKSIKIHENILIINARSSVDTTLEQWSFDIKSVFFEEVFGIKPVLRVRKEIAAKNKG